MWAPGGVKVANDDSHATGEAFAKRAQTEHNVLVLRVQDSRAIPIVGVLSLGLFVFIAMVSFGVNTSCTNAWSCSSTDCSPCRVVSLAAVGGFALGAVLGAGAIFSPWPRRGRNLVYVVYVVGVVASAALTLVVARSWASPSP